MAEDIRVSVDRVALDAFIAYADALRARGDSQFNASTGDDEASQREFDQMVANLDL